MKKQSVIILVGAAILMAVILSQFADFSQDVTFSTAKEKAGKSFQVTGTLDTINKVMVDEANFFSFYIKDKAGDVSKVEFHGPKPQGFERSESITLTGAMAGDVFKCTKILTKCPSKYNNDKAFQDKVDKVYEANNS